MIEFEVAAPERGLAAAELRARAQFAALIGQRRGPIMVRLVPMHAPILANKIEA